MGGGATQGGVQTYFHRGGGRIFLPPYCCTFSPESYITGIVAVVGMFLKHKRGVGRQNLFYIVSWRGAIFSMYLQKGRGGIFSAY